jgi:tRNA-guanine family transglycosylase
MSHADVLFVDVTLVLISVISIWPGEMLASILLTHHNLAFFLDTMRGVRQSIRSGNFTKFRQEFTERLSANGE